MRCRILEESRASCFQTRSMQFIGAFGRRRFPMRLWCCRHLLPNRWISPPGRASHWSSGLASPSPRKPSSCWRIWTLKWWGRATLTRSPSTIAPLGRCLQQTSYTSGRTKPTPLAGHSSAHVQGSTTRLGAGLSHLKCCCHSTVLGWERTTNSKSQSVCSGCLRENPSACLVLTQGRSQRAALRKQRHCCSERGAGVERVWNGQFWQLEAGESEPKVQQFFGLGTLTGHDDTLTTW
mmetsp:Transcript_34025/g.94173  ORF Transcript_34025/g.94173 Transcript_34025/m.94173 type:complete len:236 (+) Transcript_34025:445-1152(+)